METPTARPAKDIFECSDHRDYLRSYLAAKKPGLRALARRAGLKSPGYLTMLIQGERRLTTRSAELLVKALVLRGRRRMLMLAFSRLDLATTEAEKNSVRVEILRLKSGRDEYRLSAQQYSFLAVWYYPVLYAALENHPGPVDSIAMARRLGRRVTPAQVEVALTDLQAIGLLRVDSSGHWRAQQIAISTPPELRSLAAAKYHRNSLKLAEEALALPIEEREFGGLTIAIPQNLLPVVREKMRALKSELNELLSQETANAEIYQLNLQLFPVTKNTERKSP